MYCGRLKFSATPAKLLFFSYLTRHFVLASPKAWNVRYKYIPAASRIKADAEKVQRDVKRRKLRESDWRTMLNKRNCVSKQKRQRKRGRDRKQKHRPNANKLQRRNVDKTKKMKWKDSVSRLRPKQSGKGKKWKS